MPGKWIAGGLAVAAAGVGYYYYEVQQVERQLDDMAQAVQVVGSLSHSGVSIGPGGEVHVDGLLFEPHDTDAGRLRANRVTLDAGNLWELAGLRRTLDAGRLPRELGLSVTGLSLPPGMAADQQGDNPLLQLDVAGCGERRFNTAEDLHAALGYGHLPLDMGFEYRLDGGGEGLVVRSTWGIEALGHGSVSGRFGVGASSTDARQMLPALMTASLESLTVEYQDQGYYPALLEFCAGEMDMAPEEYIEHHLEAWADAWRVLGVEPGPNLSKAYARFIEEPDHVLLRFDGVADPTLFWASVDSPAELPRQLGASITVAGERFGRVDLRTASARAPTGSAGARSGSANGGDEIVLPDTGPIALDKLGDHVGRNIAVTLADGRARQGELVAVEEGGIRMRRRLGRGFMVVPIALADIAEVHPMR